MRFQDLRAHPDSDAMIRKRDLPAVVTALLRAGWTVEAHGVRWRRPGEFRFSVTSGIDWFDLEGGLDFEGEVVPLPALLEAARRGVRTVVLGDGTFGVLPEEWLEEWRLLETIGEARRDGFRFRRSQGWLLDALLATRSGVELDESFGALRKRIAAFRTIAPIREGKGFRGTLRGYQREGLGWLHFLAEVGFGGCLADDMGLGKTVQVLAFLVARKGRTDGRRGRAGTALVVAPRSLVHNWIEEAERFAPRLRVIKYADPDRKGLLGELDRADLVVTTYGVLRRDVLELKDVAFDTVVLDEAQAIKNERSQAAKAARLLQAEQRLALSGTPIENHLGELWSLFEFLNPGMLGRARMFRDLAKSQEFGEEEKRRLASALRPFLLRRTKEEVLSELPEKTEQTIWCELGARQRKDYAAIREHYRSSLLARAEEGLASLKIRILEALLRLRQVACHPGLLDDARAAEPSAKLEALLPMLEEVRESGHKALVFSQFTSFLAILRRRLEESGCVYEYLDGRTRDRKARVERFQTDPGCPLFLVSLKAGGLGLNLTAAQYVFLLDPWWNPAVEAQAIDRAHRIGQTRNVSAYRLICRDTVEEKVLELQSRKRDLADAILRNDGALLRDLSKEDLERLLS
jgi:SNF2 family DNA or RNA helicase